MPTVAERIDPASPHYDAAFAALRERALQAYRDHQRDMATDPEYRFLNHRCKRRSTPPRG